jgi:hypothetical protein
MTQRFESEELDSATVEYLRTVHECRGEGAPGIYLDADAAGLYPKAAGWGALLGVALLAATLWYTWGLIDDPINMAMLQTAGVFLGAWLVVAWLRVRRWRRRPDYLGHFKFVDPLTLWDAAGCGVWVTPLTGLRGAGVAHNHDKEGDYTGSTVTINLDSGRVKVGVKSMYLAGRLEAFLDALARGEGGLPVRRGYDALDEVNALEAEEEDEVTPPPVARNFDALPEPHRVQVVSTWWWRYPLLVVLLGLTFLGSWSLCTALRDDELFAIVKESNKPPDLRAYLVDRRNTRHRDEVQKMLAAHHEAAARRFEQSKGDAELRAGMAEIVRGLAQSTAPVVTLRFKETQEGDARDRQALFAPALMSSLRTGAARDLTNHLLPVLGPELVDFGEVQEGPAMIEIASHATPIEPGRTYRIDWTLTLQASPEAPRHVWKTQTEPQGRGATSFQMLMQQYKEFTTRFARALPR